MYPNNGEADTMIQFLYVREARIIGIIIIIIIIICRF